MPLTVERSVERPKGNSISYSQVSHGCDLQLRWHRDRIKRISIGIFLVYGSAVHAAIEAFSKGHARNHKEAVRAAVNYLDKEIRAPNRAKMPLKWEDPPEVTRDGTISRAKGNHGRLWCREAAIYWLERQVPAYLKTYGAIKIDRSEHQIFVPLRQSPTWKDHWSFEARLDMECEDDLIQDFKSTSDPWENPDKYRMQAHLYMAAYAVHYDREPHFKFLVFPRVHGPDKIQEFEITYDPVISQRYIDGVVRRKVDLIEAGIFTANPSMWGCNATWCAWHHHCLFGSGSNL